MMLRWISAGTDAMPPAWSTSALTRTDPAQTPTSAPADNAAERNAWQNESIV